jgi:hypothetical protein
MLTTGILVGATGAISSGETSRMLTMTGTLLLALCMPPIAGYATRFLWGPVLVLGTNLIGLAAVTLAVLSAGKIVPALPVSIAVVVVCTAILLVALTGGIRGPLREDLLA